MPIETTRDVSVRSLSADQENTVGERAGAAQRAVAKVRRFAWLALAVLREIVAWAWESSSETMFRTRAGKRAMTVLMGIVVSALCVYAGVLAMLYFTQRSLMYFPETIHTTPAAAGLPQAEEVKLTTSDGEHIIAWHVPPRDGKPVILYLHGNGGALRYRVERFTRLITDGIGIVAVEYRGYGGSSGQPERARPHRRCRSRLRLRCGALSSAANRALGRVARLWRRRRAGGGKTGRPRDPGSAVHVCRRGRRQALLVRAGQTA